MEKKAYLHSCSNDCVKKLAALETLKEKLSAGDEKITRGSFQTQKRGSKRFGEMKPGVLRKMDVHF